jgi:hypothetical protein
MNHPYIKDQVKKIKIKENCKIKRKLKKLRFLIIAVYAIILFQKYLLSSIANIDIVPSALDYGLKLIAEIVLSAEVSLLSLRLLDIKRTKDYHNIISSIQEILIKKIIVIHLSTIRKTLH